MYYDVRPVGRDACQGCLGIVQHGHAHALQLQELTQQPGQSQIVIDQQDVRDRCGHVVNIPAGPNDCLQLHLVDLLLTHNPGGLVYT